MQNIYGLGLVVFQEKNYRQVVMYRWFGTIWRFKSVIKRNDVVKVVVASYDAVQRSHWTLRFNWTLMNVMRQGCVDAEFRVTWGLCAEVLLDFSTCCCMWWRCKELLLDVVLISYWWCRGIVACGDVVNIDVERCFCRTCNCEVKLWFWQCTWWLVRGCCYTWWRCQGV